MASRTEGQFVADYLEYTDDPNKDHIARVMTAAFKQPDYLAAKALAPSADQQELIMYCVRDATISSEEIDKVDLDTIQRMHLNLIRYEDSRAEIVGLVTKACIDAKSQISSAPTTAMRPKTTKEGPDFDRSMM